MTKVTVVCCGAAVAELKKQLGDGVQIVAVGESLPSYQWILWLDALSESELAELEKRLAQASPRPIAVLGAKWDGFTPLPLVALCRGVISGFGVAGLRAAVGVVAGE